MTVDPANERRLLAFALDWDDAPAVDLNAARRYLLDRLLDLVPSDSTVISWVDGGQLHASASEPAIASARLAQAEAWVNMEHPVVDHWASTGDTRAVRLSDFVGSAALGRLQIYQMFWRPFAIDRTMGVRIPVGNGLNVDLACYRSGIDFTLRELEIADRISVPASRILERSLASGVITAVAESLPVTRREAEVLVWTSLGDTTHSIARRLFLAPATVKKHLELSYRKLGVSSRGEAAALVRAVWDTRGVHVPQSLLPRVPSLTTRERQVLAAAATGETNRDVGRRLGIAQGTVKRHLENAYRKLGVGTRTHAASALWLGERLGER